MKTLTAILIKPVTLDKVFKCSHYGYELVAIVTIAVGINLITNANLHKIEEVALLFIGGLCFLVSGLNLAWVSRDMSNYLTRAKYNEATAKGDIRGDGKEYEIRSRAAWAFTLLVVAILLFVAYWVL